MLEKKSADQQKEIDDLKFAVKELVAKNIHAKPNISKTLTERKYSDHTRTSRKKPIRIDNKTNVDQKMCSGCGNKLSKIIDKYTRTVEDIIPAKTYNTEYTIYRRYCKHCKKTITPKIYTALPNSRFGIRLGVFIVSLKLLGISYVKISRLVNTMYSIHVTPSTINHAITKMATAFGSLYEQMIKELNQELNIHGDETSWRIDGINHWLWVFVGKWTIIYEIDKSRGREVPKKILKEYKGNVTSDSWPAWNYAGKTHQRCHVHYKREILGTIDHKNPGKEFEPFAKRLQKILYDSQDAAKIQSKIKRLKIKKNLEVRIDRLISKPYKEKNCIRFVKRIRREKDMLFTFLKTGTDWHNNTAERGIRPNVVIRKITNGHRSEDGAKAHKILMSIKETCRLRNLNFHDYLEEYLSNLTSKL